MDGWLIQVTSGDPAKGPQTVEMYAVWEASDDDAIMKVITLQGLGEEHVVSTITDLGIEELTAHGLQPGQMARYQEELEEG